MNSSIVDRNTLKELMIRNKQFLARLYTSKTPSIAKKIIVNAETPELQVLIQILHYISCGKLPVKKCDYDNIVQKRKHGFLHRSFKTVEATNRLLESAREVQCQALIKVASCYQFLFHYLFNED